MITLTYSCFFLSTLKSLRWIIQATLVEPFDWRRTGLKASSVDETDVCERKRARSRVTRREKQRPGIDRKRQVGRKRERWWDTKWKFPSNKNQARASYLRANTHRWAPLCNYAFARPYLLALVASAASPFLSLHHLRSK